MAGTFAGALEARQIEVDPQRYDVEATGEIETDDGVLVIKRIRVDYRLAVPDERRADAERVHDIHARFCPVARSLAGAIEISTHLELL
ncbi:MAG: OsmC family protein [Solirubrobacterales bacterium]|nr:OsmC family protein [Solirubrobacterales bacterium]MBV9422821.1 OsmC family protein [Solirubrobacterales bacterium]MBV9796800.1 OsmC family protein [Solirubrobacterales bacterium]